MLNRTELDILREPTWRNEMTTYFHECLQIDSKKAKVIALDPNSHQKKILEVIEAQRKALEPVRVIVLKPRQTGSSTISGAVIYHAVRFHPAPAVIMAHDLDTAQSLFNICERFYNYGPESEKFPLKATNRKELSFEAHGPGSPEGRILVATAGKKTVGRGTTPLYLLCSEAAYYENAKTVLVALFNSIPDEKETVIIVESTANGMGGEFYQMWQAAKAGNSAYVPVFLSWKDFPEYAKKVHDPAWLEANLTGEEKTLISSYRLSLEQINWRRDKIANECMGDVELFKQEYPLNDIEAFLTSGRCRFDQIALNRYVTSVPLRGEMYLDASFSGDNVTFTPIDRGSVRIWKRPQPGHKYVIGADVARGIEIEGAPNQDLYDNSVGDVIDVGTGEQVAQIHGQFEPDEFGRRLALLGRWYNWTFVGVEANNDGLTVMNEMIHAGYPDSLIFARSTSPTGSRFVKPQKGWLTTELTRHHMINTLATALREMSILISSPETIDELRTFVTTAGGKIEAQAGSKDDRVFSLGIAMQMLSQRPSEPAKAAAPVPASVVSYKHSNAFYGSVK
ncbi:hypothetical protein LCGC14_1454130 [marine sediment metagenome]|uniref:Terminase large subunit gp17-like C-terminal domain-containing protein n=1 Tax=marine sediment metagenome TaxID=412755 RepID=A0A0F9MIU9_9ZZZZ